MAASARVAKQLTAGCFRVLLAWLVAVPVYLVVVPVLLVLRAVLWLLLDLPCWLLHRLCDRDHARRTPMRSEDALMFMETSTNRCNIVAAIELDGPPMELPALTALVDRTLVSRPCEAPSGAAAESLLKPKWPRFRQRPVRAWGRWFWEDCGESFDLSSHVWEEEGVCGEEDLAGLLARLQSEQMASTRPVWDVVLARPGTREGGSTVLIRVHHSMGDGISLVRVLLEALDAGTSPSAAPPAVGYRSKSRGLCGKLLQLGSCVLFAPLLGAEQLLSRRDRGVLKPRTLAGKKGGAFAPPVDLQRIKAVAHAHESTVSAVTVACFARALAAVAGTECTRSLMKFWVPVSLAGAKGPAEMRNDLIFVMMPMPTGAPSATAALSIADSHLRNMKSSIEAPALWLVLKAVMLLLPFSIAHPVLNMMCDKASGVFSSVPGPSSELSWGGIRVSGIRFLVPQRGGVAMGLSTVSYRGVMRASVSADVAALPEPTAITEAWMAALEELEVKGANSDRGSSEGTPK